MVISVAPTRQALLMACAVEFSPETFPLIISLAAPPWYPCNGFGSLTPLQNYGGRKSLTHAQPAPARTPARRGTRGMAPEPLGLSRLLGLRDLVHQVFHIGRQDHVARRNTRLLHFRNAQRGRLGGDLQPRDGNAPAASARTSPPAVPNVQRSVSPGATRSIWSLRKLTSAVAQ